MCRFVDHSELAAAPESLGRVSKRNPYVQVGFLQGPATRLFSAQTITLPSVLADEMCGPRKRSKRCYDHGSKLGQSNIEKGMWPGPVQNLKIAMVPLHDRCDIVGREALWRMLPEQQLWLQRHLQATS